MYGPDTDKLLQKMEDILLGELNVSNLNITSLPELPSRIVHLFCGNTNITRLPELPSELLSLSCSHTNITSLPELPSDLRVLDCSNTSITSLPELPSRLVQLFCGNTNITSLPELPSTLEGLYCDITHLTSLPELPSSLIALYCNNCDLILKREENESIQDYIQRLRVWVEDIISKKRIQERCEVVKEGLMAAAWHPTRVEQWLSAGVELETL